MNDSEKNTGKEEIILKELRDFLSGQTEGEARLRIDAALADPNSDHSRILKATTGRMKDLLGLDEEE